MNGPIRNLDQTSSAKAPPARLDVLRERAEAKVLLIQNGYQDFQSAVDELWEAAERDGLVKEFGADEVQWVLGETFGRWRLSGGFDE
jgi:hypothetical protein